MGKLIGNARGENVGERLFLAKAMEYFDDGHIIYWNRQLFGREFDVCILMPGKGILVVELKGWRPETVLRSEDDAFIIRTEDGEKAEFPQKQARGYRFSLQRHIRSSIGKTPLVFQMVGLPQITGAFYREHRLDVPLEDAVVQYLSGCKLYCVFSYRQQMQLFIRAIDNALSRRGLLRNRDKLRIGFDRSEGHSPAVAPEDDTFSAFHCSFSVLSAPSASPPDSFMIVNGNCSREQERILNRLSRFCAFNAEQYFVEHADPLKHIVIRAGAGTGKTYTMISRVDHMQISTIHAYARDLIARLGSSFGYGIDVGITSGEFYRRRKISDLLDAWIRQKTREYGKDYSDRFSLPVYAIRDSILDFISKLHNKSVDIAPITAADFGSLLPDDDRREVHELLAHVIPEAERQYAEELRQSNRIHPGGMMSLLHRFVSEEQSRSRIRELKRDKNAVQFLYMSQSAWT